MHNSIALGNSDGVLQTAEHTFLSQNTQGGPMSTNVNRRSFIAGAGMAAAAMATVGIAASAFADEEKPEGSEIGRASCRERV